MADLMHLDAFQQFEVALLGLPAAEVMTLLSAGLSKSKPATVTMAQPHPCTYTATPPAPPPASASVVGVIESSPVPVMVTMESKPEEEIPTTSETMKMKISNIPAPVYKCCQVSTTLTNPSVSPMPSTSSVMPSICSTVSIPIVVVHELAIPTDAYQEHLNKPGRGKDYLCQLCHFSHSNLDLILTHVGRHPDITAGCPFVTGGIKMWCDSKNMVGMLLISKL